MRVVTLKELVRRSSATARLSDEESQKLIATFFDLASKEIDQGNRVELGSGLAPLAMRRRSKTAAGAPVDKLTDRTEPFGISLVVPKKDFFTSVLADRLSGPRSAAEIHEGVENFMTEMSAKKPDLVVLDASLSGARDLIRAMKRGKDTSMIALVVINPEGTDPNRIEGVRVVEDGTLTEPFELNELVELAEGEIRRSHEERVFFQHETRFQFPTRDDSIEEANDLAAQLVEQSGMSEERGAALTVAFREAVDNSARHGNKSQDSRMVDVVYLLDKEKITITVTDEGDGFDTEMYLRRGVHGNAVAVARERNEAGRTGGLGIMLMLKCLDNLEYNYAGNQVKLTKYIK
jgi:anti-sigma regulatory factor (Ser/Thr protein kinase)/nucleoid DNA-binding protein